MTVIRPTHVCVRSEDLKTSRQSSPGVFFDLGFRPFFAASMLSATLLMVVWLMLLMGVLALPLHHFPSIIIWHAHEMLFGVIAAALAGFVLTASANWTGRQTMHGLPLAGLFLVWFAARIVAFIPGFPGAGIATLNVMFWVFLAIGYLPPILQARNYRNLVFLVILALLATGNTLVHLQALGFAETQAIGIRLAVYTIVGLMTLVGGRIIPFFTSRAVEDHEVQQSRIVEFLVPPLTTLAIVTAVFQPFSASIASIIFVLAGILHLKRLAGWFDHGILKIPLLWILYAGYAWIPVGFSLLAATQSGWLAASIPIHAFTAGAMGTLILGVMSRVTLGHTGRPLNPSPVTVVCYYLICGTAMVRVFGATFKIPYFLQISGIGWLAAFGLLSVTYLPMVLTPRVDGKPW